MSGEGAADHSALGKDATLQIVVDLMVELRKQTEDVRELPFVGRPVGRVRHQELAAGAEEPTGIPVSFAEGVLCCRPIVRNKAHHAAE